MLNFAGRIFLYLGIFFWFFSWFLVALKSSPNWSLFDLFPGPFAGLQVLRVSSHQSKLCLGGNRTEISL